MIWGLRGFEGFRVFFLRVFGRIGVCWNVLGFRAQGFEATLNPKPRREADELCCCVATS